MRDKPSITLPDDARRQATLALRTYVGDHFDEEIGDLKAGLLLDFIVAEIGPSLYNQGVADARGWLDERLEDLSAACHRDEFPSAGRRRR